MENRKKKTVILVFLSIILILSAFLPHMQREMFWGSDDIFHYYRIKSVADGIKNGVFPVKLHSTAAYGYGYGVGFFYSDALLYLPAALMAVFRVPLQDAYRIFAFLLYAGVFGGMYLSVNRLTGSRKSAFLTAGMYLFCNKVMESFYVTIAIGQMSALIFAPIAIAGMYLFLTRDEKPYLLMLGFIGLIYSHTISTFLTFCTCVILVGVYGRELLKRKGKFFHLICAVGIVTAMAAAFWLPMLEQMKAQTLKVKAPWTTSEQNVSSWETFWFGRDGLGYMIALVFIFSAILILMFLMKKMRMKEIERGAGVFLLIAIGMGGLTTWYPFWHFMNAKMGIKLIQFPTRLNMIVTILVLFGFAVLYTERIGKIRYATVCAALLLGGSMLCSFAEFSRDYLKTDNSRIEQVVNGEVAGLGAGEEWLPIEAQREYLIQPETAIDNGGGSVSGKKMDGCTKFIFEADMSKTYYDIPYVWYKGYKAFDSKGNTYEINKNRENGLVQVWLPENGTGKEEITVYYAGTKYQKLAYAGTIAGILAGIVYVLANRKKEAGKDAV